MFEVEVDWTYGVHPALVEYLDWFGVPEELIKVISETEVIVMSNPEQRSIFTASQDLHAP